MRPIDADALKKDLTRFYDNEVTARALIDEQPTIGWISVKKKLPEVDGLYLVYGMTDAMRELLPNCVPIWICDYYQEHGFYSFTERMHFDYITHWMPLPEPPKEDDND